MMVGGRPAGSANSQHIISPEGRGVWPQLVVGLFRRPGIKNSLFLDLDPGHHFRAGGKDLCNGLLYYQ